MVQQLRKLRAKHRVADSEESLFLRPDLWPIPDVCDQALDKHRPEDLNLPIVVPDFSGMNPPGNRASVSVHSARRFTRRNPTLGTPGIRILAVPVRIVYDSQGSD